MKKKLITLSGFGLSLMPIVALAVGANGGSACQGGPIQDLGGVICKIKQLLDSIVPVLIALGVVYFVWGVVSYILGDDEEAKKKGRDKIIFGIIGLAVIVSLWGLVGILTRTFGVESGNTGVINLPTVN